MRRLHDTVRQTIVAGMKRNLVIPALVALGLSGCGLMDRLKPAAKPEPIVAPVEAPVVLPPMGAGQSAAALDQTTAAEKAAAVAPVVGAERALGTVVVGLGSPAEQGFWIKSPLIAAPGKGRVALASGATVNVDLLPGTGGALLSLAAFRALGLGLTDLPEVTIYAQ
jgi:hypothetical protein